MARIKHGTLTPDTPATVTLDSDVTKVEVLNRNGAGEVFYLVDPGSTNPTIEGDNNEILVAAMNSQVRRSRASGTTTVKLISSAAVTYTVKAADDE